LPWSKNVREWLLIPLFLLVLTASLSLPSIGLIMIYLSIELVVQTFPIVWWAAVATLMVTVEIYLMREQRAELVRQKAELVRQNAEK
jgi:hypothetical protein